MNWWSDWCERRLIADDPYQYEDYTVDQLAEWARRRPTSQKVLINEILKRLLDPNLSTDDREILSKALYVQSKK
jgi:hypothetical protein